jgi:hypothetical protein
MSAIGAALLDRNIRITPENLGEVKHLDIKIT